MLEILNIRNIECSLRNVAGIKWECAREMSCVIVTFLADLTKYWTKATWKKEFSSDGGLRAIVYPCGESVAAVACSSWVHYIHHPETKIDEFCTPFTFSFLFSLWQSMGWHRLYSALDYFPFQLSFLGTHSRDTLKCIT